MRNYRIQLRLPKEVYDKLQICAKQQGTYESILVQDVIVKSCRDNPTIADISQKQEGESQGMTQFITFSDVGIRLLEFWAEKTGLSKSQLIIYAVQKCLVVDGGSLDDTDTEGEEG